MLRQLSLHDVVRIARRNHEKERVMSAWGGIAPFSDHQGQRPSAKMDDWRRLRDDDALTYHVSTRLGPEPLQFAIWGALDMKSNTDRLVWTLKSLLSDITEMTSDINMDKSDTDSTRESERLKKNVKGAAMVKPKTAIEKTETDYTISKLSLLQEVILVGRTLENFLFIFPIDLNQTSSSAVTML